MKGFIRCDTDLMLSGWFTSIFCHLTWHQNLRPVLVDYFGTYCSCSVQLRFVSVLNRAEPPRVREMCHLCYPISVLPSLQLGPDVCSLQQQSPHHHHLHPQPPSSPPTLHPILILNCSSVSFYSPSATCASRQVCARGWLGARRAVEHHGAAGAADGSSIGAALPEPGAPGQGRWHRPQVLLCRSCLCHRQPGPPGEPLTAACAWQLENLYPTPLRNKLIIQDLNYGSVLEYMFVMSVSEVFQSDVYIRTEGE